MNYQELILSEVFKSVLRESVKRISKSFDSNSPSIVEKAKKKLKREDFEYFIENYDLEISEKYVLSKIETNLKSATIWSSEVGFSAALKAKHLKRVFVDLDLYLSPLKNRFDQNEETKKISQKRLLTNFENNKIIFGGAGAGKTTLIKKICSEVIEDISAYGFYCPLSLRFREISYSSQNRNQGFGLFHILSDILGITISFPMEQSEMFSSERDSLLRQTILSFLDDNKILLIADGFDEIPTLELKKQIQEDFEKLALSLKYSRFIVTSRNNDFSLRLPLTDDYEICPLNDGQIKLIINKWLRNKSKADDLLNKIKKSPYYDTTMRPLTLSHLCAIYERRNTIPPKPRYIYDFVINLLIEIWDQQRSIVRPSNYANFYIEKKKEFLGHLSFFFSYHLARNIFSSDDIRTCYNKIYRSHGLPPSQAKKVVTEIENHTGLLVQIGYNSYQFSHKSLQEFLTAKHISSMPVIPDYEVIKDLPNEIAIAACLSSSPNYYFESFLKDFKKYDMEFWNVFLTRLIDEQPDFDENPSVIVFLIMAYHDTTFDMFKFSLIQLLSSTNLEITMKPFLRIYDKSILNDGVISFSHKNIQHSIVQRNYFPAKLFVVRDLEYLFNA